MCVCVCVCVCYFKQIQNNIVERIKLYYNKIIKKKTNKITQHLTFRRSYILSELLITNTF